MPNLAGEFRCLERLDFAGRVRAVRQKNEHLVARLLFLFINAFDGQRDRIANRRFLTGKTDKRFQQEDFHGLAIECQWHLQVGTLTEQDQTNAVALAASDEVGSDCLGSRKAVAGRLAQHEILLIHAAGKINGKHQISP